MVNVPWPSEKFTLLPLVVTVEPPLMVYETLPTPDRASVADTVTVGFVLLTQPLPLTAGEIEMLDVGATKSEMNAADAALVLDEPPTFATTT